DAQPYAVGRRLCVSEVGCAGRHAGGDRVLAAAAALDRDTAVSVGPYVETTDRRRHRRVTNGPGRRGVVESRVEMRAIRSLEVDGARLLEYGRARPEQRRRAQREGQN